MKTFTEAARELPVAGEYDVIVAGSGPAGASAAVTAGAATASLMSVITTLPSSMVPVQSVSIASPFATCSQA